MDAALRQLQHQAEATDDPLDWGRFCHAMERLIDPDFYHKIIIQFKPCTRKKTTGGVIRPYCDPRWCSHIETRVLGLHTFNTTDNSVVEGWRRLTDNPLWNELCGCGSSNRECDCGDNEELYNCDYCHLLCLMEDIISVGPDEHACHSCLNAVGLFEWMPARNGRWLNPIANHWTKYGMLTLGAIQYDATAMAGSDLTATYLKRYATALLLSINFLNSL